MSNKYETIIIITIFRQVLQPKSHRSTKAVVNYYFPSPGMNEFYVISKQQYVLMYYVESFSEHLRASLSI